MSLVKGTGRDVKPVAVTGDKTAAELDARAVEMQIAQNKALAIGTKADVELHGTDRISYKSSGTSADSIQ
jgi:hypothetical protein